MTKRHPRRTDEEWMDLIQECRSSGLSDKSWCEEHHIHTSSFYYQIRRLRKMACKIPEPAELTEEQFHYLMLGLNPLDPKIKDVNPEKIY